jgi:hypothetical protein
VPGGLENTFDGQRPPLPFQFRENSRSSWKRWQARQSLRIAMILAEVPKVRVPITLSIAESLPRHTGAKSLGSEVMP